MPSVREALIIIAIFSVAGADTPQAQVPTESRIVRAVDARIATTLDLLERSVNVNSGTMNFAGVRAVGRLFQAELDALGFATRWVDGAPFGRAGHLVATRRGRSAKPHVLLIGHLDTVFEEDSPFQRYEALADSAARGPGTIDMKGGNVIIILVLQALAAAGALDDLTVTVVLHGDEEDSGDPLSLARRDIIEAARAAEVAIGFEDGDGNPRTAVIARRGFTGWTLRVTGKPAHSSQVFREDIGAGAIYEAARILHEFYAELTGEQYLTFNPGVILGGTAVDFDPVQSRGAAFGKTNVIAERAVVAGDLRTISVEQRERAKERMRAIVARHLPHTSAELTFDDTYPPMAPTPGNYRLLALVDTVSRDLGFGPVTAVDPGAAGAADVSFAADHVEMAIDGLGLMGDGGHTVGETADLRTLAVQAKRAAVVLYRLSRGATTP